MQCKLSGWKIYLIQGRKLRGFLGRLPNLAHDDLTPVIEQELGYLGECLVPANTAVAVYFLSRNNGTFATI